MICKQVLDSGRVRKIPKQFGFVDHRLVREGYIDRLSCKALALYLFLVTVSDKEGLSYYGDKSVQKRLHMAKGELNEARLSLVQTGLIAYETPLYQVLSLDAPPKPRAGNRKDEGLLGVREILASIAKGAS